MLWSEWRWNLLFYKLPPPLVRGCGHSRGSWQFAYVKLLSGWLALSDFTTVDERPTRSTALCPGAFGRCALQRPSRRSGQWKHEFRLPHWRWRRLAYQRPLRRPRYSSRLLFDFGQERSQRPPKQSFAWRRHRLPLVSPALVVESFDIIDLDGLSTVTCSPACRLETVVSAPIMMQPPVALANAATSFANSRFASLPLANEYGRALASRCCPSNSPTNFWSSPASRRDRRPASPNGMESQRTTLDELDADGVRFCSQHCLAGGPPLTIFACTIPTEGAPFLRFLHGWHRHITRDFVLSTDANGHFHWLHRSF